MRITHVALHFAFSFTVISSNSVNANLTTASS